jgi:hypothetical protein
MKQSVSILSKMPQEPLSFVQALPARITIARPTAEIEKLFTLVYESQISDLFRFVDRWARLQLLISVYEKSYDVTCQHLAKGEAASASQSELLDEYVIQTAKAFNDCYLLANRLCEIACRLIHRYGPLQDCELETLSDSYWKTRRECTAQMNQFDQDGMSSEILVIPKWKSRITIDAFAESTV